MGLLGKHTALSVYRIEARTLDFERTDAKIDARAWADALARIYPVIPASPKLDSGVPLVDGWFFLDEQAPCVTGPFIVLGRRAWKKSAPAALVKRITADRLVEAMKLHNATCPGEKRLARVEELSKDLHEAVRDEVEADLRRQALPTLSEVEVVIDTNANRMIVFSASKDRKDAIVLELSRYLTSALGMHSVVFHELHLLEEITRTRPSAVVPDRCGSVFLGWLVDLAIRTPRATWADGSTLFVELGSTATLEVQDGTAQVRGADAVAEMTDHDPVPRRLTALSVRLIDGANDCADWTVGINEAGQITGCDLHTPRTDPDTSLPIRALYRCYDYSDAINAVLRLWAAFDAGPIATAIHADPQTQMWPGMAASDAPQWEPGASPKEGA